jgi:hypothetical protein
MPAEHPSHPLEIVETANGRYRLDIPATSLETDDPKELLAQIENKVAEWDAAVAAAREKVERIMMRQVEQHVAPRRDVLKRLVKKYPAPQQWYEERSEVIAIEGDAPAAKMWEISQIVAPGLRE